MKSLVFLSFDVEEFDMPAEYGNAISPEHQMEIGKKGLDAISPILELKNMACTLFTTANFAVHFPDDIRRLANKHEIASHTYFHSSFTEEHLLQSKQKLEEIIAKPITGLRMPRMKPVSISSVKNAGYTYDASINPTWLPGKYNNRHLPRTKYFEDSIIRIPAAVTPNFRIPLFWISFKNFPYKIYLKLALQTLKKDGYLCLYFHPWEFTHIEGWGLPKFTIRYNGIPLLLRLQTLIDDLQKEATFITIESYLQQKSPDFTELN